MRRMAVSAGVATAAVAVLAGCGSSGTSSGGAGTQASSAGGTGASAVTVTAHNFAFGSPSAPLVAGSTVTVTFTNQDGATHSLTLDDGSAGTDAAGGSTATFTVTAPASGTVAFHCRYHASMHGTLTVGQAGAAAPAATSGASASSSGYGY